MREIFIKEGMSAEKVKKRLNDPTLMDELYRMDLFFKRDSVAFVGKALIGKKNNDGVVIYSLPKYADDSYFPLEADPGKQEYLKKHTDTIIEVLLSLERKKEDIFSENVFAASNKEKKEDEVEKLSLAEYIINDYVNHGLYYEDKRVLGRQSKGKTAWGATIKKCQPFIDGDTAIYMKLMRKYRMQDYSKLITNIHASAVSYAYELLKDSKNYGGVIMPQMTRINEDDLKALVPVVRNYMLTAVSNRDIFLFRALEAWCKKSFHYTNLVLGTTSFHLVWEAVNDGVFGNRADKESDNPEYHFFTGENEENSFKGTGTSIIDTIFVEEKRVSVFDSKYYVPKRISDKDGAIEGYPANSDIAKQIGYLDIVEREYGKDISYCNALLLPAIPVYFKSPLPEGTKCTDRLFNISGYVTRGKYGKNEQNDDTPVLMIHVDPARVYERFLNGAKISADQLDEIHGVYQRLLAREKRSAETDA